jgi:predicted acetyltransferase
MVDVEIIPALLEQEPILANLLELYAHDFSEFVDLNPGLDGRFGYKHLHLYWEEPGRYPFIVKAGSHLAGFVFVRKGSAISQDAGIWDMAEFFILRGCRRRGVGMKAAKSIWTRFPGRWEVRVIDRNKRAAVFWRRAVSEFVGGATEPTPFASDGQGCHLFSFESKGDA